MYKELFSIISNVIICIISTVLSLNIIYMFNFNIISNTLIPVELAVGVSLIVTSVFYMIKYFIGKLYKNLFNKD